MQEVTNSLRNTDVVKTAAIEIKKSLLDLDFGLKNSFLLCTPVQTILERNKNFVRSSLVFCSVV